MEFECKKLRFRPSLKPGAMTEEDGERGLYSRPEKEAVYATIHTPSPLKTKIAKGIRKLRRSPRNPPPLCSQMYLLGFLSSQTTGSPVRADRAPGDTVKISGHMLVVKMEAWSG